MDEVELSDFESRDGLLVADKLNRSEDLPFFIFIISAAVFLFTSSYMFKDYVPYIDNRTNFSVQINGMTPKSYRLLVRLIVNESTDGDVVSHFYKDGSLIFSGNYSFFNAKESFDVIDRAVSVFDTVQLHIGTSAQSSLEWHYISADTWEFIIWMTVPMSAFLFGVVLWSFCFRELDVDVVAATLLSILTLVCFDIPYCCCFSYPNWITGLMMRYLPLIYYTYLAGYILFIYRVNIAFTVLVMVVSLVYHGSYLLENTRQWDYVYSVFRIVLISTVLLTVLFRPPRTALYPVTIVVFTVIIGVYCFMFYRTNLVFGTSLSDFFPVITANLFACIMQYLHTPYSPKDDGIYESTEAISDHQLHINN